MDEITCEGKPREVGEDQVVLGCEFGFYSSALGSRAGTWYGGCLQTVALALQREWMHTAQLGGQS